MTTVLISGASVAGPALAWWLRRHGFRPTVVERAPALREGGYKVDIRGAALAVIDRMGLRAQVELRDTGMRSARFVDSAGAQLATMDAALFGGREGDDAEIMRGDLARILADATRDVEYVFDDSIATLTPSADGVEVGFERGPRRTFDLVIGADGLHSNVRRLAFGPESAHLWPLGHHIAIFTVPAELGEERVELMHPAPGRSVGVYRTAGSPDAKALFLFPSPDGVSEQRDVAGRKALLAEAFAGLGWQVPRLLEAMWDAAPDFYLDSMSQVRMDRWSTGRIGLVGDAAYGPSPASGQGTSLSLVGAYVLAASLAAASDPVAGFADYERRMRPFVEANQALAAPNLKGMVLRSATQIRFQTLMLRLMPHLPGRDRMIRRVTEPIHRAATAITLPDAPAPRGA